MDGIFWQAQKVRLWAFLTLWVGGVGVACTAVPAYARKGNEPIYQDPFDVGSGGASLTRASRDGRVFSNPALLPHGGGLHRWGGLNVGLLINDESVEMGRSILQSSQTGGGEGSEGEEVKGSLKNLLKQNHFDVRGGGALALSWVTRLGAVSAFGRGEVDVAYRRYDTGSLPKAWFRSDLYYGLAMGTAIRLPVRWLSLGVTGKYIRANEIENSYGAGALANIDEAEKEILQDVEKIKGSIQEMPRGIGFDVGALMFLQGEVIDYSLAAKVDDYGDTTFDDSTCEDLDDEKKVQPACFPQSLSAGTGVTIHSAEDAIHLAVDYRDITGAYDSRDLKKSYHNKIYAGAKFLFDQKVGAGIGLYRGAPSYGLELDLFFLRLSYANFVKLLGPAPGIVRRRMHRVTMSMGF